MQRVRFILGWAICLALLAHQATAFAATQTIQAAPVMVVPSSVSTTLQNISITAAGGTVPVQLRVSNGTLAVNTTTGLTFQTATSGSVVHFEGNLNDVNAALASLTYTSSGSGSDTLEISLVEYGQVFYAPNGHIYEYVQYDGSQHYTWDMAFAEAAAQNKYGAAGYLATITSQGENDFVNARLLGAGWMAASDRTQEGDWRWKAGPEANQQFWSGNYQTGQAVGGMFNAWAANQPDNSFGTLGFNEYENCAQFGLGASLTGKWNDLPCSLPLPGYVVEYGAPGNLPAATAKNVTLVATNTPPDTDGIDNLVENQAPNGGDANNDGILDSLQNEVASFVNPATGSYAVIEAPAGCNLRSASGTAHTDYPTGLTNFSLVCPTAGFSATMTITYFGLADGDYQLDYHDPTRNTYRKVPGATITKRQIAGQAVMMARYTVQDGGAYDEDGIADGIVIDPVGLRIVSSATPAATASASPAQLASTGANVMAPIGSAIFLLVLAGGIERLRRRARL